jgi:LysR family transcriptional regulator, regulator of abg operon
MKNDPRRLLDLLAIARHGSISGAAEAMSVSQPGLSQSLALLEREFGLKLFDRTPHGVRVNEFGDALLFHAKALEALLARAQEEMRLRAGGLAGVLSIGIMPPTAVGLVPRALDALMQEAPGVFVSVTEALDSQIMDMLRTRQLDLLVSRIGVGPAYDDVAEERLLAADWVLITASNHPLADRKSVKLSDLHDVRWALPAPGSSFHEHLERMFASAGQRWPQRGIITNSILAIKSAVMTAGFVAVTHPRLVEVEVAADRLRAIPLEEVEPPKPIGLIVRRNDDLSPVAARFVRILRSLTPEQTE